MQAILAVPSKTSAVICNRVERNITNTEEQWSRDMRSKTMPSNKDAPDVAELSRAEVADTVKAKFVDIFEVGENKCTIYNDSILESVEKVNVAGRLSRPESIQFFESIGAPDFIL